MTRYYNLEFDDACDILQERTHRQESQIVERGGDFTFEPVEGNATAQPTTLRACLLGEHLEVAPATRSKLLQDFGLRECAASLPPAMLTEALNHVMAHRLHTGGSVKVWHDTAGRLIHIDWTYRQRVNMESVEAFRSTFHAISMKNHHTLRHPGVLVLADQPTHVDITTNCEKVREVMPSDTLLGGVMLRHSETGVTPTTLYATIFRAFCRNQLVYGFSKSDPRYLGDLRIPVGLNDIAGGLASGLGSLLNRMRRLAHQPSIATEEAMPIIQTRWNLAPITADTLLEMANDQYLGHTVSRGGCLYDILNTFTAVTTHRHGNIPHDDCQVLEQLSDALLSEGNPLQRLLCRDMRCPDETLPETSENDPLPYWFWDDLELD